MLTFLIGAASGIAASLVTNYLFPSLFAKLTRKAGKVVEDVRK